MSEATSCSCVASSIGKSSLHSGNNGVGGSVCTSTVGNGSCNAMFQEPFFLHPPGSRARDGLYINPMTANAFVVASATPTTTPPLPLRLNSNGSNHKDQLILSASSTASQSNGISSLSSASSNTIATGSSGSFFLHSPHELVYTRVAHLFDDAGIATTGGGAGDIIDSSNCPIRGSVDRKDEITVKADVHHQHINGGGSSPSVSNSSTAKSCKSVKMMNGGLASDYSKDSVSEHAYEQIPQDDDESDEDDDEQLVEDVNEDVRTPTAAKRGSSPAKYNNNNNNNSTSSPSQLKKIKENGNEIGRCRYGRSSSASESSSSTVSSSETPGGYSSSASTPPLSRNSSNERMNNNNNNINNINNRNKLVKVTERKNPATTGPTRVESEKDTKPAISGPGGFFGSVPPPPPPPLPPALAPENSEESPRNGSKNSVLGENSTKDEKRDGNFDQVANSRESKCETTAISGANEEESTTTAGGGGRHHHQHHPHNHHSHNNHHHHHHNNHYPEVHESSSTPASSSVASRTVNANGCTSNNSSSSSSSVAAVPPAPPPPVIAAVILATTTATATIIEEEDQDNQQPQQQQQQQSSNSSCSSVGNGGKNQVTAHLVNRHMVLPFIPPQFASQAADSETLLKPSEYLRSICKSTVQLAHHHQRHHHQHNSLSKARSVDNLDLQGRLVVESIRRKSECTEEAAEEEEEEHQQQQRPQSQLEEEEEEEEETAATGKEGRATNGETLGPPPPPLPPPPMGPLSNGGNNNNSSGAAAAAATAADRQQQQQLRQQQPLATISIQDLTSVQLRRTNNKMHAAKTFSAPPNRSVSMTNVSESFFVQKTDLIAELKKTKDIPGIKKMKVQRAQVEKSQEQNMMSEISKTFSIANFVDQIPEKDSSGNVIPIWKRQMLARKAAERAKKELEEQIARENEEKRQKAIPPWKRQLLAKKESCGGGDAKTSPSTTTVLPTPRIEVPIVAKKSEPAVLEIPPPPPIEDSNGNNNGLSNGKTEETTTTTTTCNNNNNNNNNHKRPNNDEDDDTETVHIIPWRAQLRKTNSKLNILD